MSGINKVILVGNLGRDPEVRYTQDGMAVTNFTLATSESWKDKASGETKEKTEWHRIVAFRRLGEICGEYLAKGRQVYIEGRLRTNSYEKDGITRYATVIHADIMQMLGTKGSENHSGNYAQGNNGNQKSGTPPQPAAASANAGNPGMMEPPPFMDDDIPF